MNPDLQRYRSVAWLAAGVLLGVALASGFWVWRLHQQRAAAEREVEAALQEASRLQEESKWPEALLTIRRAESLLQTDLLGDELRQRVQDRLKDLTMVDRLEQIRLEKTSGNKG
jgi:hypothetical protein